MSKNRFAGLQAVKQLQENKQTETKKPSKSIALAESPTQANSKASIKSDTSVTPRRGRPNGKRSSVDFQQVTAYVRRDTYRKVSIKLLDREVKGEFSELMEELLQKWLKE